MNLSSDRTSGMTVNQTRRQNRKSLTLGGYAIETWFMKIKCAHTDVVDIETLVPHPRNANKHSEKQLKLLAKIMKHQGWRHPVTVSKRSGFVVAGHGRIEAARINEWEKIPVDFQEFETEADEYAHLIADNKIAELSEVDMGMINEDALKLGEDFDFDLLGIPDFGEVKDVNNTGEELDIQSFDNFQHECPKCGFEWNDDGTT